MNVEIMNIDPSYEIETVDFQNEIVNSTLENPIKNDLNKNPKLQKIKLLIKNSDSVEVLLAESSISSAAMATRPNWKT